MTLSGKPNTKSSKELPGGNRVTYDTQRETYVVTVNVDGLTVDVELPSDLLDELYNEGWKGYEWMR